MRGSAVRRGVRPISSHRVNPAFQADRCVVGGGIFGCFAALTLADQGHQVILAEQDTRLLNRASFVNQARLHTGLHYPRSILTARDSFRRAGQFRQEFPDAVRDLEHYYAVSARGSKSGAQAYHDFIERLDLPTTQVDPGEWFHSGTVSCAFRVEEPSFDAMSLREDLHTRIQEHPNVTVWLSRRVSDGHMNSKEVDLRFEDGTRLESGGVVIASYAATNAVRKAFGLEPIPLTFELTEVILGDVDEQLENRGFTVMDGPFWSLMPFGHSELSTLTSVGYTPLRRTIERPAFDCQRRRNDCDPGRLAVCDDCSVRPPSAVEAHRQQMKLYLRAANSFTPRKSLLTVKAILATTEVDDARPTLVSKDENGPIWTIFSGKVSSLFELEEQLV